MKKILKKNIIQRKIVQKSEKARFCLKILQKNSFLPLFIRWKIQQYYFFFNRHSSLTQIKNRCFLTGRSKSISRKWKLSRLQLRLLISKGMLSGFSKYNW